MSTQTRLLTIVLFFYSGIAVAQDSMHAHRVGVSYLSQGGIYPGFTLNYEKKLLANEKLQVLLAGKAGAYFHYRNNTGVFVMIQSGQRFRVRRNFYFEHFLGVGYLQSFLNGGDAYYVNASGQVQRAHTLGNPHFMPSLSFGVSYDLNGKNHVTLFVRPMIYWQIPFNEASLVQYALEVGTLFKLKK
jgi:hypothetical protein